MILTNYIGANEDVNKEATKDEKIETENEEWIRFFFIDRLFDTFADKFLDSLCDYVEQSVR